MDIADSYNVRVELIAAPQQKTLASSIQIRYCSLPDSDQVKTGEVLLETLYIGIHS